MNLELKNQILQIKTFEALCFANLLSFLHANKEDMRNKTINWLQQITFNEYLEIM